MGEAYASPFLCPMFIVEIKICARAGHGGKGCVAFQREKYRPKGGPSGGNGGRGGDVILEADHDLNNLIAQYFQPRLIAQEGQGGLGKGMDGHAGKDLIVKIPCGTMVWRLAQNAPEDKPSDAPRSGAQRSFAASSAQRPMLRTSTSARAMELDLSAAPEEPTRSSSSKARGDLMADLTQHGQRFVLCKGGRGGL